MADQTQNSDDSDISEAYAELNRQAPLHAPVSLDATILAEAHRAVNSKPKATRSPIYRWAPPLAMAATVLLTATLVVLVPTSEQQQISTEILPAASKSPEKTNNPKKESRVQSAAAVAQQNDLAESFELAASPSVAEALAADVLSEPAAVGIQQRKQKALLGDIPNGNTFRIMSDGIAESNIEEEVTEPLPPLESINSLHSKSGSQASDGEFDDTQKFSIKVWRERIDELLSQSKWEEADREFAQFKAAFPNDEFIEIYSERRKQLAPDVD